MAAPFRQEKGTILQSFVTNRVNRLIFRAERFILISKGGIPLTLEFLKERFTVCRVAAEGTLPAGDFVFYARTDAEYSLVCPTENVPVNTLEREDGWRGFRIRGQLDFSLVGILAPIAALLAEKRIGIFAVSTFLTDYVLFREADLAAVKRTLGDAGYALTDL